MNSSLPEGRLVLMVAAIQFIKILSFMMVIPLGPDFAQALGFAPDQLGLVSGAYALAAALAGLAAARFLDGFDRRDATAVTLLGLALAALGASHAQSLPILVIFHGAAGVCGGLGAALALAMIIDVIPAERRGRALGIAMGAFSVSAVVGVPIGLELARIGAWYTPFQMVAVVSALLSLVVMRGLPPMRLHWNAPATPPGERWRRLFLRPAALLAYATTGAGTLAAFLIIPNISAYFQFNLNFPREQIGWLYGLGGVVSFFTMRLGGRLTDWAGDLVGVSVTAGTMMLAIYLGYVSEPVIPLTLVFVLFMISSSLRGVVITTVVSKVPGGSERAGFMSVNAAMLHLCSGAGSLLSVQLLETTTEGQLLGMPQVAWLAIAVAALLPLLVALLGFVQGQETRAQPLANRA